MSRILKTLFFIMIFVTSFTQAQELHFVEIGVNGLHCSACSFTVEKALKKVEGVAVVQMDLNERSGKIFFEENKMAELPAIAKAVTDAGYSVRFLNLQLKEELVIGEQCALFDYCLVETAKNSASFQLIDDLYLPKKEWKNIKGNLTKKMCGTCTTSTLLIPL